MERLVACGLCHGLSLIHADLEGPGRIFRGEGPKVRVVHNDVWDVPMIGVI